MSKIRSKETKPEVILRKKLWQIGLRYRKNYKSLKGVPDIVFLKEKVAIFVDGEFWHGYNWVEKKKKINSNRSYWIKKIEGNIERDTEVKKQLASMGWKVLRFWEKEVKSDLEKCVSKIINALKNNY
jgi:DNA mismatch endonuclease (patch repair protein)